MKFFRKALMYKNDLVLIAVMLAFIAVLLTGVTGCKFALTNVGNDELSLLGIKMAAFNLGHYIGKSKTDNDDFAVKEAYAAIKTGQFSNVALFEALQRLKLENGVLAANCTFALQAMGAAFNPSGGLIDASGIPEAAWLAAEGAYTQGLELGRSERKQDKKAVASTMGRSAWLIPYQPAS